MNTIRINLILSIVSTLLTVVLVFYGYGIFRILRTPPITIEGGDLIQYDPKIGYRPSGNSRIKITINDLNRSYDVITDSTGARISGEKQQIDSSTFPPITVIGCSFTWGLGISNNETYSQLVGDKLHLQIQNHAMGGYGSVQSFQMLEQFGSKSHLIIYGFLDDHLRRNVTPCAPSDAPLCLHVSTVKRSSDGQFYIDDNISTNNIPTINSFFSLLKHKEFYSLKMIRFGFKSMFEKLESTFGENNTTLPTDSRLDATEFILRKMESYAISHEAHLIVVNVGIGNPSQNFLQLSKRKWSDNVSFLDASKFDGFSDQELQIRGDGHPNAKGNELIATRVYDFIIRNKLTLLEGWRPDYRVF